MSDKKLYKIRRKSDGKFSNGGQWPKFTKDGKSWSIGHLKTHLNQFTHGAIYYNEKLPWPYNGCEIVEFVAKFEPTGEEINGILEEYKNK